MLAETESAMCSFEITPMISDGRPRPPEGDGAKSGNDADNDRQERQPHQPHALWQLDLHRLVERI